MTPFDYYWEAFWNDLGSLICVLLAAGVLTMIPSWILAWWTAEGISGVTNARLLAAAIWAWVVAACAGTWAFFVGVGGAIQLQRSGVVQIYYTPQWVVVFGGIAALVIGLLFSYRSTRRYMLRCVELRFDPKLAAAVARARAARFSLGTLLFCQVLGLASFGLWLECHRDSQERQSAQIAKNQYYYAWMDRMRERNFEKYGWSAFEDGEYGGKPQLALTAANPQPTLDDEALQLIVPEDRILRLTVRSDQITDEGLRIIGGFRTLQELTIESSRVTDQGIAELRRLPQLRRLTLKCPLVTEASLAVLSQFPPRVCIAVECEQIRDDVAQQFGEEHYNISFPPRGGVAACCLR